MDSGPSFFFTAAPYLSISRIALYGLDLRYLALFLRNELRRTWLRFFLRRHFTQSPHLVEGQVTIGADRKVSEVQVADLGPFELDHGMAGEVDHAPYLAFSALVDRDLDPGVGLFLAELSHLCGRRSAVLEENALFQILDVPVLQKSLDLHQVGLRKLVPGMGHQVGEITVVRQQEQALGVVVEPAHGIDTDLDALQEMRDDRAALGVRHGRDETGRFVQHDVGLGLLRVDEFTVDLDVIIVRVGLGSQFCHDLPVHPHPAFEDDIFRRPA